MEPDRTHSEPSTWQAAIDFGVDVTLLAAYPDSDPDPDPVVTCRV